MKYLYCGYVSDNILRNLEEDIEPRFEVTAIPIMYNCDSPASSYIQVDGFYFVGRDRSTEYFTSNHLDHELILNYGTAYYSTDEQKCIDFVNERYKLFQQLVDKYKIELDKQGDAQIHIETNR